VGCVVDNDGVATADAICEAISWLLDEGASIVAIPLGGSRDDVRLRQLIQHADDSGSVFFSAAANGMKRGPTFPADYPSVIAVGPANATGQPLFSNAPHECTDLLAPGWDVLSFDRFSGGGAIGSSTSCVIAAGVAALALSSGAVQRRDWSRTNALAVLAL
jgi:subtilisin family serine protease